MRDFELERPVDAVAMKMCTGNGAEPEWFFPAAVVAMIAVVGYFVVLIAANVGASITAVFHLAVYTEIGIAGGVPAGD